MLAHWTCLELSTSCVHDSATSDGRHRSLHAGSRDVPKALPKYESIAEVGFSAATLQLMFLSLVRMI